MSTDRREFLGALVGAGLMAGAKTGVPIRGSTDAMPGAPTLPRSEWDVSWTEKLGAKTHRALFDSPEVGMGLAMLRSLVWIQDYADVYNTQAGEMGAVVVLRHNGIWIAMNDDFYKRFGAGAAAGIKDPKTKLPIRRNPFINNNIYPDLPSAVMDHVLHKSIQASTATLACNLAFQQVVEMVKKEAKLDDAAARKLAVEHLVPGITLQPSGVFAVTRAQEAGCQYMLGS